MTPPARTLDPEATRASILDAARRLFFENGVAGTSMSRIAAEADVTKSLIHHHFGSKDELWDAVKDHAMDGYFAAQHALLETSEPDVDLMDASIETYFRYLQSNPDVARFLAWMHLEGDCAIIDRGLALKRFGVQRLSEGQADGRVRPDIDPGSVLSCFLGLVESWFNARHMVIEKFELDPATADETMLDTMRKIFRRGLEPHAGDVPLAQQPTVGTADPADPDALDVD